MKPVKGRMTQVGRNDPCPCGSGKKYKQCHAANEGRLTKIQRVGLGLALAAIVGGLILVFASRSHDAAPGGIWSAEHGHYH